LESDDIIKKTPFKANRPDATYLSIRNHAVVKGHVTDVLEECVMTMNAGEVASFTIPPQHAFGGVGSKQYHLAGKDGFGCLLECQIFGHFSSIMDK